MAFKQDNMEMHYCDHGGGIVEALNVNIYVWKWEPSAGSCSWVWDRPEALAISHPLPCLLLQGGGFRLGFLAKSLSTPLRSQQLQTNDSSFNGYVQDLVCLLEQLNVNETIYLGHSMSAMIGCMAARKRPELFQHLILLSGSPRYLNDKGYNGGFERSELDTIFTQMDEKFSSWVKNFTPVAVGVKCTSAITQFQSSLGRMKPKIALSVARTVFLSDMRWFCHKFQCLAPSSNPKKMSSFRNPLHST
jgi:pimeloyl-ACP methyl ester carboxylesterase